MAYKFEIIGSSLIVTDTVSGKIIIENPKKDTFFDSNTLIDSKRIQLYNTVDLPSKGAFLWDYIPLSQSQNAEGTIFTESLFRDFARENIGKGGGSGNDSSIDTEFFEKSYTATMSVEYDFEKPNFEVVATGNLNLTLTGTVNGDAGIVNIYFAGGERTVVLNGFLVLEMTETNVMCRTSYIHDKDGLKWHRDLNWREDGNVPINGNLFRQNGDVQFGGAVRFTDGLEAYLGDLKVSPNGMFVSSAGGNNPIDVGIRRNAPGMMEFNNGTAEQYANAKGKSFVLASAYANDAAATADTELPIGGLYYITGNSSPKIKLA